MRILVVDDEHDTTDSFAMLLGEYGHTIRKAYNGESVLQLALAFVPDVILLDIGLPGIDGYEVARRLQQYPSLAATKIVALSGYATAFDVGKCADLGFYSHLAKPIQGKKLKEFLESISHAEGASVSGSCSVHT